jgi:hypothetical protein
MFGTVLYSGVYMYLRYSGVSEEDFHSTVEEEKSDD